MLRDEAMRLALLNSAEDVVAALGSAAANASTALSGERNLPAVLVLGLGSAALRAHASISKGKKSMSVASLNNPQASCF